MMVKRYVVKEMPEAIVMIRRDLGKDAVILSTRQVSEKRWFGLRRHKRLEVLAAAGEDMPIQTKYGKHNPIEQSSGQSKLADSILDQGDARAATAVRHDDGPAVHVDSERRVGGDSEKNLPDENRQEGSKAAESKVHESSLHSLQQELRRVSQTLDHLVNQSSYADSASERVAMRQHLQFLKKQGLESDRLLSAIEAVWGNQSESVPRGTSDSMSSTLLHSMKELLPECISSKPLAPSSRVIAFVGQTGVGKTTTIAKIAALQMLSANKNVGLITADTFRIAAIEQLRTYARILGIPLEVVYHANELEYALKKLEDRDLILIDTAGRNFRDPEHFQDIRDFLELPFIDETHLVLSLTTKAEDLLQCANHFQDLPIDKFLFTKLDETSSYGAALELLYRYQRPVSYLTNGQNVPDDLEIATLDRLLKLVLEGAA